jgi:hypothetical protein
MSHRVLVRQLHEVTFNTPDGPLTVAIALLLDRRVAIYEWDEEHGSRWSVPTR